MCQQGVGGPHHVLHQDAEEEEGEGDSNESIEHTEYLALCGERCLLTIAYSGDHCPREEE